MTTPIAAALAEQIARVEMAKIAWRIERQKLEQLVKVAKES